MKRRTNKLARILINTLTAISLILALATAGLWVRSVVEPVLFTVSLLKHRTLTFHVSHGTLSMLIHRREIGVPGELNESPYSFFRFLDDDDSFGKRAWPAGSGFAVWHQPETTPRTAQVSIPPGTGVVYIKFSAGVTVPLWFPCLPAGGGLALIVGFRARRHRRSRDGHCPACGYDIRANPARCSECGARANVDITA